MQLTVKKGSTDRSVYLYIIDSTDGTPEQGVNHATSGLALWYRRVGAAATAITPAELAALTTAHTDGGIIHIDDGLYRVDVPDAAFATGVGEVVVGGSCTGMIILPCVVQLVNYDPEDGVRLGLTALPNAAADAAGGLPISDAGGFDVDAILARLTATRAGYLDNLSAAIATAAELAKVPKSDAAVSLNSTALAAIADAVLDEVVDGTTITFRQAFRAVAAAVAGKVSGAPDGPVVFRDLSDTKDVLSTTIDEDGNRTAVVADLT